MTTNNDLNFVLKKMNLFKNLTDEELTILAPFGKQIWFDRGKKVIRENQEKPGLFVLISGEMEVLLSKDKPQSHRLSDILLTTIKRGDYVGEYSLIDAKPASATVVAKEKCLVFHISCGDFDRLVDENKLIANKIYRNMLEVLVERERNYDQELDILV